MVFLSNRSKNNKRGNKSLISKKEMHKLRGLVEGVNVFDEDSVWNLGVELGNWSVKLRSLVLSDGNDDEMINKDKWSAFDKSE